MPIIVDERQAITMIRREAGERVFSSSSLSELLLSESVEEVHRPA